MRFCTKCGRETTDIKGSFCDHCGAQINSNDFTQASTKRSPIRAGVIAVVIVVCFVVAGTGFYLLSNSKKNSEPDAISQPSASTSQVTTSASTLTPLSTFTPTPTEDVYETANHGKIPIVWEEGIAVPTDATWSDCWINFDGKEFYGVFSGTLSSASAPEGSGMFHCVMYMKSLSGDIMTDHRNNNSNRYREFTIDCDNWINGFTEGYAEFDFLFNDDETEKYQGETIHSSYTQGMYTYSSGDWYEGEFKDGNISYGKYYRSNGDWYEGGFKGGKPDGNGKYNFFEGGWYEGEYEYGTWTHGKRFYSSGDWYEGEFKDGRPDGNGQYHFFDGDWYEGEFPGKGTIYIDGRGYPATATITDTEQLNFEWAY